MTGFIGLAYEGISNYLCNKRQDALQKAFDAMEKSKLRKQGFSCGKFNGNVWHLQCRNKRLIS